MLIVMVVYYSGINILISAKYFAKHQKGILTFPAWNRKFARFSSVKLAHECFQLADNVTKEPPLLIIHGLLGSKKNWQSLAKAFSKTGRRVITVDARNHGSSPFSSEMTYELMSDDVEKLIGDLHLGPTVIIGHSMGGKIAMTLALKRPDLVNKLIVEDVAPIDTPTAKSVYPSYLEAMKSAHIDQKLNIAQVRRNVGNDLRHVIEDRTVRNFLLNNIRPDDDNRIKWTLNIDGILGNVQNLAEFPKIEGTYNGPTLFVAGGLSQYVRDEDKPKIKMLFPNAQIIYIPKTGHWVHYDSPGDFLQTVLKFLRCS